MLLLKCIVIMIFLFVKLYNFFKMLYFKGIVELNMICVIFLIFLSLDIFWFVIVIFLFGVKMLMILCFRLMVCGLILILIIEVFVFFVIWINVIGYVFELINNNLLWLVILYCLNFLLI